MDSQDITTILKSLIESGVLSNSHIYIILFIIVLFSAKKVFAPLKSAYDNLAKHENQETMIKGIDNLDESLEDSFKDIDNLFKQIDSHLSELQKKVDDNHTDIQVLKTNIDLIKSYLDKVYFSQLK